LEFFIRGEQQPAKSHFRAALFSGLSSFRWKPSTITVAAGQSSVGAIKPVAVRAWRLTPLDVPSRLFDFVEWPHDRDGPCSSLVDAFLLFWVAYTPS